MDAKELTKAIKRAAIDAVNAMKPVHICFGEVISISPLKINVEQKMLLGKKQLILSRNVTDFATMVSVKSINGIEKKEVTIHNALKVDDKVILLRQQEGQKYVVMDRIGVI